MKRKFIYTLFVLLLLFIVNACMTELDIINPDNELVEEQTYTMSIVAGKSDNNSTDTRALGIDEAGKLTATWNEGEIVTVYNETKQVDLEGSLVAQSSGKRTTLSGTITGHVSVGDKLLLKFLSPNYSTQDGTLTGSETSIDKVCDYSTALVSVSDVSNGIIRTTGDAVFNNQQTIVKFSLRNEDNTASVSVKSLTVNVGDSSYLVSPLVAMSDFYVALPSFTSKDISLVGDGNDFVYSFTKTGVSFEKGKYYTITVRMTKQTVMAYILDKVLTWNVYSPEESLVNSYLECMNSDGSFTDIDYSDKTNGNELEKHFTRLLPMAYAYISQGNSFYSNDILYSKIVAGIEYWLTLNPKSTNWYHNQINEPQFFGLILIAMRKGSHKLPENVENGVIDRWRNNESNPAARTGSNRSEMALNWMFFSCLTESEDTLSQSLEWIFEPVAYTGGEGLQVDGSFFQHGPQLYIGGYGEVMLESVLQTAVCVKGTKFALPSSKLSILRDYVLKSYSNVIRGEVIHWNAIGRQLTRPDFLRFPERRIPIIEKIKDVDVAFSSDYIRILRRLRGETTSDDGVVPYHQHFYRGDYTIHVRPGYSFSTRMVSSRTCRQESINGENLLGYFLSDGSTAITVSGKEYWDLMPLWDWNRVPGVTAPKVEAVPTIPSMTTYGTSSFAGGVSDQLYGCSAYKYYDSYNGVNTGASKGYFFFDDVVICLGAGINSTHSIVNTTINQCWGKEDLLVGYGNSYNSLAGDVIKTDISNYQWLLHDDIGYYFPGPQTVVVENTIKTGSWKKISTIQSDKMVSGKVFTLGIEHEAPVSDAKYEYHIMPNSTATSISEYISKKDISVLANTDSVQVVYHSPQKIYECIFYRACSYKGDMTISSSKPCAMIIKDNNDSYQLHVADPSQSRNSITIGIRKKGASTMVYGSCDFSGVDELYAGATKEIKIVCN